MKLSTCLEALEEKKVLVIGDFLLDAYTFGKARRISPEAPVAVVNVSGKEYRPGGSGNVVLNLLSLGMKVAAVGRVGNDHAGDTLRNALLAEEVDLSGFVVETGYKTPIKNRIIAANQQIVRLDEEEIIPLSEQLEEEMITSLPKLLEEVAVVAISDYGKGFLTPILLSAVLQQAKKRGIPVITDPKGLDFSKYSGSTVIKPNISEAIAVAGSSSHLSLPVIAQKILEKSNAENVIITLAERGIFLFNGERSQEFPVRVREVKDVTGAGDTVLAVLALALANGLSYDLACQLCNVAAGIAIEVVGCARVTLKQIATRLLDGDTDLKFFDKNHLYTLKKVLEGEKATLLSIDTQKDFSLSLFQQIHTHKKRHGGKLVICIQDRHPDEQFLNLLSSHHDIDFIIHSEESLPHLCSILEPAHTVQF